MSDDPDVVDLSDPRKWKKPTREAPRYESRPAQHLRDVKFQKVYNDQKFYHDDIEWRRVPLAKTPGGKLYNARMTRLPTRGKDQSIADWTETLVKEFDEKTTVTIVQLAEVPWNEWG